jgi:hypothetical protein
MAMAKARKRRAGRPNKAKAKRGKKRVKAARSQAKRKTLRTKGRKKKAARRKRTTAEGMRRALRMKQAADQRKEEMQQPVTRTSPTPPPVFMEPDPIPHNLREQGDIANIIQNTSHRRAG